MKSIYILLCSILCSGLVIAQNAKTESDKIVQNPNETLASEVVYRFPEFTAGTVFFKNNTATSAKLNYNQLMEEMQFLDPKGDTLAIANVSEVSYIQIGEDSFYMDKGAAKVIGTYPPVHLAVKTKIREVDREKFNGFGMASSTSAVNSYSSILSTNRTNALINNERIVYMKELFYFLVGADGKFQPVNKSAVSKAFSIKPKQVEEFIKSAQLDLKKEADIRKLLNYAASL